MGVETIELEGKTTMGELRNLLGSSWNYLIVEKDKATEKFRIKGIW